MEEIRHRMKQFSNAAASTEEPLSWFEKLYSSARGDDNWIPWSDGSPSPFVVEWAIGKPPGRALVVGCGLGEDAVFLEKNGWDVVAFDLSPTAVEWAKKRHEKSSIEWVVADLLNPPDEWISQFELVLEDYANLPLISKNAHIFIKNEYSLNTSTETFYQDFYKTLSK